ncbi:MAG: nucleoid-structuring protein H-NS [Candidatus Brocadiaceae bacterium]|nr:nucleoid-structuring protein H-NS [Candidatus Brocadiaceae bacterium]
MQHVKSEFARGSWLTYRPDIKILDCTVRDGGLINNHRFDDDFVRAVYRTCVDAGVDYMEMGYKGAKSIYPTDEFGPWKHCDEEDLRRIVGDNETDLKISVMADAERCDYEADILPKSESVIDAIRVACYIHQIPVALDMIRDAHEKGYEVVLQLMAVSVIAERELDQALQIVAETPVTTIYLVDSFGALYSEQVRDLVVTYMKAVEGKGKEIGIHAHNNQQLAYANTIEALIHGASRLDATLHGMGRGAGNCATELLLGFLKNPKFHLRPVLKCIQEHLLPLKEQMEWGPSIPYIITGQLNRHPRAAIAMRQGEDPDDYVRFYDQMTEEE